jgi:hypothetical protein
MKPPSAGVAKKASLFLVVVNNPLLRYRVGVNTTTPPIEKINSINSWADVRNAEVRFERAGHPTLRHAFSVE